MSTHAGSIEQLEAALADMGRGMTYPPTPDFAPAVLAAVETARRRRPRRLPALWPVTPRLVIIIALTLLLLACAAVAAYFALYPIPKGFNLSVGYGNVDGDAFVVTAEGMERLVSSPSDDSWVAWSPDCSSILFTSNRVTPSGDRFGNGHNIWVLKAGSTDPVQLTFSHDVFYPHWSPDGTRFGYSRAVRDHERGPRPSDGWTPSKSEEVYVINADGSGETSGPTS